MNTMRTMILVGGIFATAGLAFGNTGIEINEIRIDQPGGDVDEYFELSGNPGMSLDGLTYLVIGDGAAGSGVIDNPQVVDLTGQVIPASGFFVVAEATFTLGTADLVTDLPFENSDNVTHLLVQGFTGMVGDDLDLDDDGVLDITPWTAICDCVALIETVGTGDQVYCATQLGPNGTFVPSHAFRDATTGDWTIGEHDPAAPEANDTPGEANGNAIAVNLDVFKSGPVVATGGAQITYTLTVVSDGTDPAASVSIVDTLPAGMSFVSETSSAGVTLVDMTAPTIEWTIASFAGEETIELTVLVDLMASGNLVNSVVATTTSTEDFPGPNTDEVTTAVNPPVTPPAGLRINEFRIDQPTDMLCTDPFGDCEEFFELKGTPGTDLSGLTYLVIGDGDPALGSGLVEDIISLNGQSIQADGYFVAAEKEWTGLLSGTVDYSTDLRFENSDNVTHLLVTNFTGGFGDDLDTDDDGDMDIFPWSTEIDVIGVIEEALPPVNTEFAYGDNLGFEDIGPDGMTQPAHVYRCETDGLWMIGTFDPLDAGAKDTPDADNPMECGGPIDCPGDVNGDLVVDVDDIVEVVLDFASGLPDGNMNGIDGDCNGDLVVDIDDIVCVIVDGPFGNVCN